MQDIIDSDPDVFVIVDASWDSAIGKIDYLHNHSDYCDLRAVQDADYIKIQFSASTLGPRNGVAALDMVSAAMHARIGSAARHSRMAAHRSIGLPVTNSRGMACRAFYRTGASSTDRYISILLSASSP